MKNTARPIYVITLEIVNDMQREYKEALSEYYEGTRKSKPKHWREKYCYFTAEGSQMGAMLSMNDINENYGFDSGNYVVACGLGNLTTWRGAKAREIKKELRAMLK